MNRGTRLAIVAGIIIAIAGFATFMAVSSAANNPVPLVDNNNATNSTPRQITIDLNENLNVGVE